jgi:photosystem II stability/assembly factor-like uncharacterized protein
MRRRTGGFAGLLLLVILLAPTSQSWSASSVVLGDAPCPSAVGWTELSAPEPWRSPSTGADTSTGGVISIVAGSTDPELLYAYSSDAVYRSTDCGGHWEPLALPSDLLGRSYECGGRRGIAATILRVAVDAAGSLFVGTCAGWVRSDDNGRTWNERSSYTRALSVSPNHEGLLYAIKGWTGQHHAEALVRSLDAGRTWEERIGTRGFSPNQNPLVESDPLDANIVFLFDGCAPASSVDTCTVVRRSAATSNE